MKFRISFVIISILVLTTAILGYSYARIASEYAQMEQIRRQEVPDFVNRIDLLEEENAELRSDLSSIEQYEQALSSKEAIIDELSIEGELLRSALSDAMGVFDLTSFSEYRFTEYDGGFYYDLEFAAGERERLNGYIKLLIDDIYFDEKLITETRGDSTKLRIVSAPVIDRDVHDDYMKYKYLMDKYVVAHLMINDFCNGLKYQDYSLLESTIIEDDLYPDEKAIKFILDAYADVVDLDTLEVSWIGIGNLGYEYLIKGTKGNESYKESIHVSLGDGLIYIADYRGRYEWTGHHKPLEDW